MIFNICIESFLDEIIKGLMAEIEKLKKIIESKRISNSNDGSQAEPLAEMTSLLTQKGI